MSLGHPPRRAPSLLGLRAVVFRGLFCALCGRAVAVVAGLPPLGQAAVGEHMRTGGTLKRVRAVNLGLTAAAVDTTDVISGAHSWASSHSASSTSPHSASTGCCASPASSPQAVNRHVVANIHPSNLMTNRCSSSVTIIRWLGAATSRQPICSRRANRSECRPSAWVTAGSQRRENRLHRCVHPTRAQDACQKRDACRIGTRSVANTQGSTSCPPSSPKAFYCLSVCSPPVEPLPDPSLVPRPGPFTFHRIRQWQNPHRSRSPWWNRQDLSRAKNGCAK